MMADCKDMTLSPLLFWFTHHNLTSTVISLTYQILTNCNYQPMSCVFITAPKKLD